MSTIEHVYKLGHSRCQRCDLHKTFWEKSPNCKLQRECVAIRDKDGYKCEEIVWNDRPGNCNIPELGETLCFYHIRKPFKERQGGELAGTDV